MKYAVYHIFLEVSSHKPQDFAQNFNFFLTRALLTAYDHSWSVSKNIIAVIEYRV
jgi:hypothetical protein